MGTDPFFWICDPDHDRGGEGVLGDAGVLVDGNITTTVIDMIIFYINESLARKNYKSTISRSKSIYYNKKIALISSNPRKLFKIANKILSPPDEKILPILPNTSNFQLCSLFEKFFNHKIASINNIICACV